MFEIEAVGVEFWDAGGCNENAGWVGVFEDVKGEEKGLAEGG